jgi:proteasome accessory factor C
VSTNDRLQRLLAVIPWVAAQDGPTIKDVCERFDVRQADLLADLQTASFVGAWPRTPDELVEVIVEDDRVWVHFARSFDRPLQLTPEQGLALLAAASGVLARPGTDPAGALATGLQKLARTLDIDPEQALEVDFGHASPAVLDSLQRGASDHRLVEIDYYSYGRDDRTTRAVEPMRVYTDQGRWYVLAWCRRAEGERLFRVDRIHSATLLDEAFAPRQPVTSGLYHAEPDAARVTVELAASAAWVVEQYPVEQVDHLDDGRLRVTIAVGALPWLERLLLSLGPEADIVHQTAGLPSSIAAAAAGRVLNRYR